MLAGLGLGAGVAVGSVGAAIGLASARQEVKWQILLLKCFCSCTLSPSIL